jgi:hypothetical protein
VHTQLWLTIICFRAMAAYMHLSALVPYRKPALLPYFSPVFCGLGAAFMTTARTIRRFLHFSLSRSRSSRDLPPPGMPGAGGSSPVCMCRWHIPWG